MAEPTLIDKIAEAVVRKIQPPVPLQHQLWTHDDIKDYLRRASVRGVAERLTKQPDFPKPIRVPSEKGGIGHPLYKAVEVIAWVEGFQEKAA